MTSKKRMGVLFSGGMDSSILLNQMLQNGYEVWPIYLECGLPWEKTELAWAKKFLRTHKSKNLKPLIRLRLSLEGAYKNNWSFKGPPPGAHSADSDVFLPARNLILLVKAFLALSSKNIWSLSMAILKGNPFPDARKRFLHSVENILSQSFHHPIKIETPFRLFTKKSLLKSNRNLPLHLTYSCIDPQGMMHCGTCNKCMERRVAFSLNRIPDKTPYKNSIFFKKSI
ncbi:MAG: 7-cyano-7-deazaguanine synthase [Elusimicrobia bacterium]|nr:7-cyano-7-deazaguanine synthase [Elusimicrobiota bacterium]